MPLALAIIGGLPEQFKQFADIHERGAKDTGKEKPALSINSHGFITETSEEARDIAFPAFKQTMIRSEAREVGHR